MPEIRGLGCPSCGARVAVAPGQQRTRCEYCRTELAVRLEHGEMALQRAHELVDAVRGEQAQMRASIERSNLLQERLVVAQRLAEARAELAGLDAELRSLHAGTPTRQTRARVQRLQHLRPQIVRRHDAVAAHLAQIDAALHPSIATGPPLADLPPATAPVRTRGSAGANPAKVLLIIFAAFFGLGFACLGLSYLSPVYGLAAVALIVLGWKKPALVERLMAHPLVGRFPAGLRATPRRFALIVGVSLLAVAMVFGALTYGPGGLAYRTPTPVPVVGPATPVR